MRADPGASAGWKSLSARLEFSAAVVRLIWRPTNVPAVLALSVIVLAGFFADHQNRRVSEQWRAPTCWAGQHHSRQARRQRQRQHPAGSRPCRDARHRARHGPAALCPARRQSAFARNRSCATSPARPDLVVSLIYPMDGNEQAIGLDYRKNEAQREAALRRARHRRAGARRPGRPLQGGQGFIGRFPVFIATADGGRPSGASFRRSSMSSGSTATAACSTRSGHRYRAQGRTARAPRASTSSAATMCVPERSGDGRRPPALRLLADRRRAQGRLGRRRRTIPGCCGC